MIPARRNRATNAYAGLMTDALEEAGCKVNDFSPIRSLLPLYDIVHIHWPHVYAHDRSYPIAVLRCLMFGFLLWLQRAYGARIVWTVHDVRGMGSGRARLETALMRTIVPVLHGVVFLNNSSREVALRVYPGLARKRWLMSCHALYGATYPKCGRTEARRHFGIDLWACVAGFVGDIKPYKGLDELLAAYHGAGANAATLFVAGSVTGSASLAAEIEAQLAFLRSQGAPIVRMDRRLAEKEMSAGIAACDVLIAPYKTSWNSGIATLALEHDRPLLCPDLPIFRELQDEVGERWVSTYEPPLTIGHVQEAVERAISSQGTAREALLKFCRRRSWLEISWRMVTFYDGLMASYASGQCTEGRN